jgi:prolipoprotein diacylglyceryltransferase
MTFPVHFDLMGRSIPAHAVFEILAYAGGFQLYLLLRRRQQSRSPVSFDQIMWVLVGCVFGALIGSKLLAWAESPAEYARAMAQNPFAWLGGKTIVGGLLGGWIGVEITKKTLGVTHSTGDTFVFPLILGIAVGRIGCFLTGLPDHTHGVHTNLPWAVDFGDGPRHPTQLYEIAFLLLLGVALAVRSRRPFWNGQLFRLFMLGYLLFRFFIEFIKPSDKPWLGLSAIQIACVMGATVSAALLIRGTIRPPVQTAYCTGGAPVSR